MPLTVYLILYFHFSFIYFEAIEYPGNAARQRYVSKIFNRLLTKEAD